MTTHSIAKDITENSMENGESSDSTDNNSANVAATNNEQVTTSRLNEKDHNSNLSGGDKDGSSRLLNYSTLTHEQLISELIKAHARIDELEQLQEDVSGCPDHFPDNEDSTLVDGHPSDESFYENVCYFMTELHKKSVSLSPEQNQVELTRNNIHSSSQKSRKPRDSDCFVVAYQHEGDFPMCDQDLIFDSTDKDHEGVRMNKPIDNDNDSNANEDEYDSSSNAWENDSVTGSTISGASDVENTDFPLIESPVLDTPPYEYIFLTKDNEAKFRIFLNQKLNKVFQEELQKLQRKSNNKVNNTNGGKNDEHVEEDEDDDGDAGDVSDGNMEDSDCYENLKQLHNNNKHHNQVRKQRRSNNSSQSSTGSVRLQEVKSTQSNVIHCFDPSDVDLELKRIFTSKPPITHKIVRRRSRKDRGSSVPAVDSYYGTSDLNKVGHASYFIPTLTESERRAIGWKPDYHFGHWKYSTMNVPNTRANQVPLHPHPHLNGGDSCCSTKHNRSHSCHHQHRHHHHHRDSFMSQNPLHQKEICFSDPFLREDRPQNGNVDEDRCNFIFENSVPSTRKQSEKFKCKHTIHMEKANSSDSLSFITLSGLSAQASNHSCHLIPDKCTLKRFLRWILPSCAWRKTWISTPPSANSSGSQQSFADGDYGETPEQNSSTSQEQNRLNGQAPHEIQTLVEVSDKLTFPVSHTHISFQPLDKGGLPIFNSKNKKVLENTNLEHVKKVEKNLSNRNHHVNRHKHHHHGKSHSHHHHRNHRHSHGSSNHSTRSHNYNQHKHHSHHYGFFQWKNILQQNNKSNDSMDVVGGDVLDSNEGSNLTPVHVEEIENNSTNSLNNANTTMLEDGKACDEDCCDVEDEDDQDKQIKRSRAYLKLLTLKDLGYEIQMQNPQNESDIDFGKNCSQERIEKEVSNGNDSKDGVKRDQDNNSSGSQPKFAASKTKKVLKKRRSRSRTQPQLSKNGNFQKSFVRSSDNGSSSSDNTGNEGDDDTISSSCGSGAPLSSSTNSQENSIATTHFYYDVGESLPGHGYFGQPHEYSNTNLVESRFLDPKDIQLPKYRDQVPIHSQNSFLPFVYDNNGLLDSASTSTNSYEKGDGILEWSDKDFQEIEEELGLINSCLDSVLSKNTDKQHTDSDKKVNTDCAECVEDDNSDEDTDVPEKSHGQHKILTLNELENEANDVENSNKSS